MYAFALTDFNPGLLGDMLFTLFLLALAILVAFALFKRKSDGSISMIFVAIMLFVFVAVMFTYFKREIFSGVLNIKYNIGSEATSQSEKSVEYERQVKSEMLQKQREPAPQKQKPQAEKQVDEYTEKQKTQQASVENTEDQHEERTVFIYRNDGPETEQDPASTTETYKEQEPQKTVMLPDGSVVNINLAIIDGTHRPKREPQTTTIINPTKKDKTADIHHKKEHFKSGDSNKVSVNKCKRYEDTNLGILGLGLPFGPSRTVCLVLETRLPHYKKHERNMIEGQLDSLLTQFFGKYEGIFRDNNDYDNPEDPSDQARLDKKFNEFIHQSKNHGFVGKNWQGWLESQDLEVTIDFYLKHDHHDH